MEQLRLAGVHDDGEHLVVEDEAGTRHLLRMSAVEFIEAQVYRTAKLMQHGRHRTITQDWYALLQPFEKR